ncbi:MAG: biotin/lipoyl-binding protein [Cytophagaceae bacterium]|nr:MAG: biotin/lipoyl-binding protein [Cytophagaceae bacterium]
MHKDYVAAIQAVRNVELRAKIAGSLEKILVDEGRFVKQGQPLFKLNDQVVQVELERSRAALESMRSEVEMAELDIKRVKLLVDKKVISKTELDLAEAKLQSAEARVREAATAERFDVQMSSCTFEVCNVVFRINGTGSEGTKGQNDVQKCQPWRVLAFTVEPGMPELVLIDHRHEYMDMGKVRLDQLVTDVRWWCVVWIRIAGLLRWWCVGSAGECRLVVALRNERSGHWRYLEDHLQRSVDR